MTIKCSFCESEILEPGALIFSPPDDSGWCMKYHMCVPCYDRMVGNE